MTEENSRTEGICRRGFLGMTAAGGVAAVGAGGCSALVRGAGAEEPVDMAAVSARIEQLDQALARIDRATPVTDIVAAVEGEDVLNGAPALQEHLDRADVLVRGTCRTLILNGMLLDIPEEARGSADYLERAARLDGELTAAMIQTLRVVRTCPAEELRAVNATLRAEPSLIMQVCETLHRRAGEVGVGRCRRQRLRAVGRSLSLSLQEQPLEELLATYARDAEQALIEHGLDPDVLDRESRQMASLWLPPTRETSAAKSPEEGSTPEAEPRPADGPTPCVRRQGDAFVITGDCSDQDPQRPPPTPDVRSERDIDVSLDREVREERSMMEEYESWRDFEMSVGPHDARGRDRRHRAGIGLLISGAASFLACGVGLIFLIAGAIVISGSSSFRAQRRQQRGY
jgi:hypothetical protein